MNNLRTEIKFTKTYKITAMRETIGRHLDWIRHFSSVIYHSRIDVYQTKYSKYKVELIEAKEYYVCVKTENLLGF